MNARQSDGTLYRKTRLGQWQRRLSTKWWRLRKRCYWWLRPCPAEQQQVVFIVGCQRSGTTMLGDLFERDLRATLFSEDSAITGFGGDRLRLKPIDEVQRIFRRCRTPLVVAKPLVESQHTRRLLQRIERSKAIWAFRDYRDVVASNLQRFHRQRENLRPVVDGDESDWRAEHVSGQTRAIVRHFYSPRMSRADAAALQWYTRNVLFFELDLDTHCDVLLCKYEDLVAHPQSTWRGVYEFLHLAPPQAEVLEAVDAQSVGRGRQVRLSLEVDELCQSLQQRLDTVYGRNRSLSSAGGKRILTVD